MGSTQIFIVGSQRTGTTLMRYILGAHPLICSYEENTAYIVLDNNAFDGSITNAFKVPMYTILWPYFKRQFPDAKYLFMRRDPLDAAASMISLDMGGQRWIDLYGNLEIEETISAIPTGPLKSFYEEELASLKLIGPGLPKLAVLVTYAKQSLIPFYKNSGLDVMEVIYEDLVKNPKQYILQIFKFIGVDPHENCLHHHEYYSAEDWVGMKGSTPVNQNSVGKHKSVFNELELEKCTEYLNHLVKNTPKP